MSHAYRDAAPALAARYCLYCGGRRSAANGACALCGAGRGAAAMLPSPDDGALCPRCARPLASSNLDGEVVLRCAACFGCFVPERAWSAILDRVHAGAPAPLAGFVPLPPGRELPPGKLCETVACPLCARPAERITFGARSGVVVDVCASHGIWFDAAEIVRVKEFVREREEHGGVTPQSEEERREELLREGRAEVERLAARAALARAQAATPRGRHAGPGVDDLLEAMIETLIRG